LATTGGQTAAASPEPFLVSNGTGRGHYVVVCEHASNRLPAELGTLGLTAADMQRHIAWDPGALPVARRLAERLDSPLVEAGISRLAIDCNRPLSAPDLVPALSETTRIPGNEGLDEAAIAERVALSHRPFHDALSALIDTRLDEGRECRVVSVHSFTPVYKGVARPWHVGVIHDDDDRLARPLLAALSAERGIVADANQPYSPADRVYYTLERHARARNLPCAMIEIRNDEIADEASQMLWADRLATILSGIQEPDLNPGTETAAKAKGRLRA